MSFGDSGLCSTLSFAYKSTVCFQRVQRAFDSRPLKKQWHSNILFCDWAFADFGRVQAVRNTWEPEEDFVACLCKRLVAQISTADKAAANNGAALAAADRSVALVATGAALLDGILRHTSRMGHTLRAAEHAKLCQRLHIWLAKHVERMPAAPLCRLVRAAVDVGRIDDVSLAAVARRLHRRRSFCTTSQRARMLATFARAGYVPAPGRVARLCRQAARRGPTGVDAANILWALAQYAPENVPENVPEILAQKVTDNAQCQDLRTLASATWSLCVLRRIATPEGTAVAELLLKALAQEQPQKVPVGVLRQVMHSQIIAQHCGGGFALSEGLAESAAGAWLQAQQGTNSTVGVRLERLLRALEVPHEMEVTACDGLLVVAVVVERSDDEVCLRIC